jgi:hypothetical protein
MHCKCKRVQNVAVPKVAVGASICRYMHHKRHTVWIIDASQQTTKRGEIEAVLCSRKLSSEQFLLEGKTVDTWLSETQIHRRQEVTTGWYQLVPIYGSESVHASDLIHSNTVTAHILTLGI